MIAERDAPARMVIPRRFAIAAKEVTVEQYQRFVKDRHPRVRVAPELSEQLQSRSRTGR